jgi:zinc protease
LPQEEPQQEERRETVTAKVPLNDVYIAFQMEGRMNSSYYVVELMSDILSRGNSSRLYRSLIKEKQIFSEVHAYITGSLDKGMFVLEGKPLEHVSIEQAEQALWQEVENLKNEEVPADELTKVKKNRVDYGIFRNVAFR